MKLLWAKTCVYQKKVVLLQRILMKINACTRKNFQLHRAGLFII